MILDAGEIKTVFGQLGRGWALVRAWRSMLSMDPHSDS